MSPYYTERDDYYKFPTYPLKGVNVTLKDYQNGPLENWTTAPCASTGATNTPSSPTKTSTARSSWAARVAPDSAPSAART